MIKNKKKPHYSFLFFIFILLISKLSFGSVLNAQFSTNPAAINGIVRICKTQTIVFTNTSSNTLPSTNYNWQFIGGNITSATTQGPHSIIYNTPGTYTASLNLNNGTSFSVTVIVNNSTPSTPTISLINNNSWSVTNYNGQNYFSYCNNSVSTTGALFSFTTQSSQTNSSTIHVFDWGDGNSNSYVGTNLNETTHFYSQPGYYILKYTVNKPGSCSSEKIYNLYIGSTPTATISTSGIPSLCNPGNVTYTIIYGEQNTPDTIYTFQVNDGSNPIIFNHPPPSTITHQYLTSSCGTNSTINNVTYPNSFQASITTSNPCGNITNAVGPINIQSAPIANFTKTPNNNLICEETTVAFRDTTEGGFIIGGPPNYSCSQGYKRYWTIIGPGGAINTNNNGLLIPNQYITSTNNFGFNNNQPNNPALWLSNASITLNVTFHLPGEYTISLHTGSISCGMSEISQTICVSPRIISDFNYSLNNSCAPSVVSLNNLPSNPGCNNSNNYLWTITPIDFENCQSTQPSDWVFSNGNLNSFEPEIIINSPGVYNLSLTTSLTTPTAGQLCQSDTKTKTITIKGKPKVILSEKNICEDTFFTIDPVIFNCYGDDPVSYLWNFGSNIPESISSIYDENPLIKFDNPGTYNYTLTVSNECGTNIYNNIITVSPSTLVEIIGPENVCVNTNIQLNGTISGGTSVGIWSADIQGGAFLPNEFDLNPIYIPPINYVGNVIFTLTSYNSSSPCPPSVYNFTTNLSSNSIAYAGEDIIQCENETINLNGNIIGFNTNATWSSSVGGIFSNTNDLNSSFTPPLNYIGEIIITLTLNDSNGLCNVVEDYLLVNIIPKPVINSISDLILCNGESINIDIIGENTNIILWSNTNSEIGLENNGSGNINFTAINTSNSPITSTITVMPINEIDNYQCEGLITTFTITVYPSFQTNEIEDILICNNNLISSISFNSNNNFGTTIYSWTNSLPSIGLASNGSGDIPEFIATNTSDEPLTAIINVIPTFEFNGKFCVGNSIEFSITVYPSKNIISQLSNYNSFNISCKGENDGSINLNVTGGSGSYEYSWTGPNDFISFTSSISNLIAGEYTVTIYDNSCIPISQSFTLIEPNELELEINTSAVKNVNCYGSNNGQLGVIITQESSGLYTYELFLNDNIVESIQETTQLNPIFSNLFFGNYTIKITDQNGCIKLLEYEITQPNEIIVSTTSTGISCYGADDASIALNISGGIPPYTINWSNLGTGEFQNNLAAGNYTITIIDNEGCVKIVQETIANLPLFTIQPIVNQISCFGSNNGSIDLGLIGGQQPIIVSWSDGSNAGLVRNNLSAGQYSVIISDASNCPINRTFIIIEPEVLSLNGSIQNDLDCNSSNNGSINLIVNGGSAPYQYSWSNGANTEDLVGLSNGNYNVTVTDARGCIATKQFTIFRPNTLTVNLNVDSNANCSSGIVTHSFEAIVNGGVPPYQINWSNGVTSGSLNQFMTTPQNGLITVSVVDSRGCYNTASYNINNSNIGQVFFETSSFFLVNFGEYSVEDPIEFINLSNGDIQSLFWNFGDGQFSNEINPFHTYLNEGLYTVELNVTFAYGCIKKFEKTIKITKGYKLIIPNGFTANNDNINETFAPAFEGLKSLQFSIYDSWGNLIFFEEGDNLVGWHGNINNVPAENGNYFYKLTASTFFDKKIEQSGVFVLIK
jgi:gliding motility-associated-like protein